MRYKIPAYKNGSGFTLIETMIVVAIVAIMAGVAIPAFIHWMPNYSLKSAAQDVYSDLQLAKMEAVESNAVKSVIFYASTDSYEKADSTVVNLSEYGHGIGYGNGNATEDIDGGSFSGDFITYTDDKAEFNSRGMMNNDSKGFVYLENNKGTSYAIGSQASGVVELRKWNGSKWE